MSNQLLTLFGLYLFAIIISDAAQITGWVYADNWFEMYFNGEKVATDPLYFYPHNAVYINFTAPDTGLYSFAIWTQDYANSSTGLEPRIKPDNSFGGWCVGDGGIRIALSDGTVSGSNWMCYVVMEGPLETACQGECLSMDTDPNSCTVQYNSYPSCWNATTCSSATTANGWVYATEYTVDDIGYGRPPNSNPETYGYTYPAVCSGLDATTTTVEYQTEGCIPADKNWGSSVPMWTSDLNLDNRLVCRYQYCVGGGSDCTAEGEPSSTTTTTTTTTSSPTTSDGSSSTSSPTPTSSSGSNSPTSVTPSPTSKGDTSSSGSTSKSGISTAGMIMIVIVVCIAVLIFGYVAFRCLKSKKRAGNSMNYQNMGNERLMDQQL